jgi:hypothetical protein
MATISIKNFPDDLHKTIRKKARENHSSIRVEVIRALEETLYLLKGQSDVTGSSRNSKPRAKNRPYKGSFHKE